MSALTDLIARSHSPEAASAQSAFIPTQSQMDALVATGRDVLAHTPYIAGPCAMMSAVYAARLQTTTNAPVYVVAGELWINETRIFGYDATTAEWGVAGDHINPDWDGHCWVVFGEYIADASVCRTAYSNGGHPVLKRHILEKRLFKKLCG